MEVTDVRVFPVEEEKLKAFVSIIFDDCFVVSDIKIITATTGSSSRCPARSGRTARSGTSRIR